MEETLHSSLWKHSAPSLTYPALTQDADVDVCIVGTGFVGITTAYFLLRACKTKKKHNNGPVGWGETGHTTGHLCTQNNEQYFFLSKVHGADKARLVAESHSA